MIHKHAQHFIAAVKQSTDFLSALRRDCKRAIQKSDHFLRDSSQLAKRLGGNRRGDF